MGDRSMKTMENKVALVTGAAQGIGLACAQAFAREGADVILADLNKPEEQAQKLVDSGLKAHARACDVSDASQVEKLICWIVEKFGRLDAALNNAGVQTPQRPMAEITDAVIWLCSPGASFMAGHALLVDGGFTIR